MLAVAIVMVTLCCCTFSFNNNHSNKSLHAEPKLVASFAHGSAIIAQASQRVLSCIAWRYVLNQGEITLKKYIFIISLVASFNLQAAVNCSAKINHVYVSRTGEVVLHSTINNAYHSVCSLNSAWKSVSTEVCKGWLSISQTAQVTKSTVIMRYNLNSCSDIGAYSSATSPEYIMLYGL